MSTWQVWPPDDGRAHSVTGRILHRSGLEAPALGNQRDVWVCLPAGYRSSDVRYPVLYMQDGQNLFDRAIGFSGQEWHIDETLAAEAGRADAIVVGIANTGAHRLEEYSPFRDTRMGGGKGELYLDFVVDVVKPLVDLSFRTLPGRDNTFIGGSSMGALISLHAFLTRPHVFGGVAALSPALWFAHRAIFDVVAAAPFSSGRVYVDIGTREGPVQLLDVARLRNRLVHKGYRKGEDLLVVVEGGARHNEAAWARRFPRALRFLLGVDESPLGRRTGRKATLRPSALRRMRGRR
jgi:predicted alpha/beta superfamily hydrolase